MTQEQKELLLKDLCARLPYGVKAQVLGWDEEKGEIEVPLRVYSISTDGYVYFETNDYDVNYLAVDDFRLYLRPISSMTEDEKEEMRKIATLANAVVMCNKLYDFFNSRHIDYHGLIEKGLAIAVTKENNPYSIN